MVVRSLGPFRARHPLGRQEANQSIYLYFLAQSRPRCRGTKGEVEDRMARSFLQVLLLLGVVALVSPFPVPPNAWSPVVGSSAQG